MTRETRLLVEALGIDRISGSPIVVELVRVGRAHRVEILTNGHIDYSRTHARIADARLDVDRIRDRARNCV